MTSNVRYEVYPQMRDYDSMPSGYVPYAMLSGPSSFQSAVINTDVFGFRVSHWGARSFTVEHADNYEEVSLLIGGSTVFGVGATKDSETISSHLCELTKSVWLNLGIRGAVALQEYIHLISRLQKFRRIQRIVFFSGMNDVYANLLHDDEGQFDRRFGETKFELAGMSWKRQAAISLFSQLYSLEPKQLYKIPLLELIKLPLNHKKFGALKATREKRLGRQEKLARLDQVFRRNFELYAALSKQLKCDVLYVRQPFFPWTKKQATQEEGKVLDYLLQAQFGDMWRTMIDVLCENGLDQTVHEMLCSASKASGIRYLDSSPQFNSDEALFVDNIHLNDKGNANTALLIYDNLLKEYQ